jgi:hypothetical protein
MPSLVRNVRIARRSGATHIKGMNKELPDTLDKQTSLMSDTDDMRTTPAFKEIEAMGEDAVSDLIDTLKQHHPATVPILVAPA